MSMVRFDVIEDVPEELTEFYFEKQIEVGAEQIIEEVENPGTGEIFTNVITTPIHEAKLAKRPAYYEDGGHISPETMAAWNFHDAFIEYLDKREEVELYNSTPQYDADGEPIEVEPVPLPPKPKREDF